jgi:hypothetical protein
MVSFGGSAQLNCACALETGINEPATVADRANAKIFMRFFFIAVSSFD